MMNRVKINDKELENVAGCLIANETSKMTGPWTRIKQGYERITNALNNGAADSIEQYLGNPNDFIDINCF